MRNQRGQGSVELVLLAPLLVVFTFLIFEFGRVFGSWLIMTNAAREGARVAITQNCDNFHTDSTSQGRIRTRVQETAQFLSVNSGDIAIGRQTTGFEVLATVTATYRVNTLTPITGNIPYIGSINYPGSMDLIGRSTMRCE
jgi:Flp pilus assembly protein TadG